MSDEQKQPCTCETFGNGVVSGDDGRLRPEEGCPRHGFGIPDRIAVDARGHGWRVWGEGAEAHWSMVPTNPDNSSIPMPVTWFDPIALNVSDDELSGSAQVEQEEFRIRPGASPLHVRAVMARRGLLLNQLVGVGDENPLDDRSTQTSVRVFIADLEKWLVDADAAAIEENDKNDEDR